MIRIADTTTSLHNVSADCFWLFLTRTSDPSHWLICSVGLQVETMGWNRSVRLKSRQLDAWLKLTRVIIPSKLPLYDRGFIHIYITIFQLGVSKRASKQNKAKTKRKVPTEQINQCEASNKNSEQNQKLRDSFIPNSRSRFLRMSASSPIRSYA